MSAIGKGDWVQCIDPDCTGQYGVALGGVYCVYCVDYLGDLGICSKCQDDGPMIEIVGSEFHSDRGWCKCQFVPLGGNTKTTPPRVRALEDA